ncbi:MAG: hypothetical protein DRN53_07040 [Thermoprotei archaeon]|nr:MAG: hypothetical protein DRN53_07040 [Thermoprotei archaeon]
MKYIVGTPKEVVLSRTKIGRYNRMIIFGEARRFFKVKRGGQDRAGISNGKVYIRKTSSI